MTDDINFVSVYDILKGIKSNLSLNDQGSLHQLNAENSNLLRKKINTRHVRSVHAKSR